MIGTTDIPVDSPEAAVIDNAEIAYLCDAVNLYFETQIGPADVVSTWSGVRPLYNDGASAAQEVTRDYVLELDDAGPPMLSVFGGKITTARHLAEEAIARLGKAMRRDVRPATRDAILPGGDIGSLPAFIAEVRARYPFLGDARAARMARAYGSLLHEMLDGRSGLGDLFGDDLGQVEVDWLVHKEWARTADDIVWRRTKLGLTIDDAARARLAAYVEEIGK